MATYAIGDVQGCYRELMALLELTAFNPAADSLWLCGDLVNRGPDSLAVLRELKNLGDCCICVLGNHDLHLLAIATLAQPCRRKDTLDAVLSAPDRHELLDWLRHRPLFHHDPASGFSLVHAGLHPRWTITTAATLAREVEAALRGNKTKKFFKAMYGNTPANWSDSLTGDARLRTITNYLTRLRYCRKDGSMDFDCSAAPGAQNSQLLPWYSISDRNSRHDDILFGHWSTLRLNGERPELLRAWHLDTGCLWGGELTALRLEDRRWFSVPSQTHRAVGKA